MATTTTNYGMTKPAQTDYYDVDIFNGNADIADAALKDLEDTKLDADGDASNLSLDTITSSSASYPTFTSGLLLKTIFGRIQKFLNDLKANCVTSLSVSGKTITYTKAGGGTGTITTQDTTYSAATTSAAGLMSAADKTKLNGIMAGAALTGVKGNAESSYRTGNVNLTPANIGAAASSHSHSNATTSAAGFLRALSGSTSAWLRGDGTWQTAQNNWTTTGAGYVLDARVGKALYDRINSLIFTESSTTVTSQTFTANGYKTYSLSYTPPSGRAVQTVINGAVTGDGGCIASNSWYDFDNKQLKMIVNSTYSSSHTATTLTCIWRICLRNT